MLHASFRLLFISLCTCFFLTAHSAPARATRPLLESSIAAGDFTKTKSAPLEEVLRNRKMGLSLESPARQAELRAQAKRFTSFRTPASFFETFCRTPAAIQKDSMCSLENDRRKPRDTPERSAGLDSRVDLSDIKEAKVETLTRHNLSTLTRGFGGIDSPKEIEKITARLTQNRTCYSSALYIAAANKTEEFFPEASQIKNAKRLYEKAAECSNDELSMRARYRYSLLQLWQNSCEKVDQYLTAVETEPTASAYHSRARYWRHQCALKSGSKEIRVATERALMKNHPLSFHSVMINGESEQFTDVFKRSSSVNVIFRSVVRPDLNLKIAGVEALLAQGSEGWAGEYLDRISGQLTGAEPEFRLYAATLASRSNNMIAKFRILSSLFEDAPRMLQASTLKMYFPLSYFEQVQARSKSIDPYLILSLIRQESAFNSRARSPVGARGLMQVMPATARSIASVSSKRLFDPQTNIQVGTKYFAHRLNQFNGDVGLTLAAYNAGASRVDRWVKRYEGADKVLFMDLIPFRETRDYVASILRNHYWYTKLYEKKTLSKQDRRLGS